MFTRFVVGSFFLVSSLWAQSPVSGVFAVRSEGHSRQKDIFWLADFEEGSNSYGLRIQKKTEPALDQAKAVIARLESLDPTVFKDLGVSLEKVAAHTTLDANSRLAVPPGAIESVRWNQALVPVSTESELGNWAIEKTVFIRLPKVAQAGVWLHHALTQHLRSNGKTVDGAWVRRIVAFGFSSLDDDALAKWYALDKQGDGLGPLFVKEVVYSDPIEDRLHASSDAARKQAQTSYALNCAEWKKKATETINMEHSHYIIADCGDEPREWWSQSRGNWSYYLGSTATLYFYPKKPVKTFFHTLRAPFFNSPVEAKSDPKIWDAYETVCADWRKWLKTRFGADLVYSTCGGTPESGSKIANSYSYVKGVQRADWLGYEPSSRGKFIVRVRPVIKTRRLALKTTRHYFTPGDNHGEAVAFTNARNDFARKCADLWSQADLTRLVHIDCEHSDSEIQDTTMARSYTVIDNNYWMRATAEIYEYP